MKFTIDKKQGRVSVDGVVRTDIALDALPAGEATVRWWGEFGEVEYTLTDTPRIQRKRRIVEFADYQPILDLHAAPVVVTPPTPEQIREAAKADRAIAVDAIKVTTQAGHTFDGDETSQGRMARAIIALQATGAPSVVWVLADNTVIQATAAELSEALALAGAAQAALWVI